MLGSLDPTRVGIRQATRIIAYLRCRQIHAGEVDALQLLSLHFQAIWWHDLRLAACAARHFERPCTCQKKAGVVIIPVNDMRYTKQYYSSSAFAFPRRQGIAAHTSSRDTRTQGWAPRRLRCRPGGLCRMARWLASDVWLNAVMDHGGSSMCKGMQAPTIHITAYRSVKVLQEKNSRYQNFLVFGHHILFRSFDVRFRMFTREVYSLQPNKCP